MFEIEVVRFDAQDVIATSGAENCANNPSNAVHLYVSGGKFVAYSYNSETGKYAVNKSITGSTGFKRDVLSGLTDGWYVAELKAGMLAGQSVVTPCADDVLHPLQ